MSSQEHAFLRGLEPSLARKVNGAYWKVPNVEQAASIASEEELLRKRYAESRGFRKPFFNRAHGHGHGHLSSLEVNSFDQEDEAYGEEAYEDGYMQLHAMSNNSSYLRSGQAPFRPTAAGGGYNNFSGGAAAVAAGGNSRGSAGLRCHYCGRSNHFVRDCRDKMADQKQGIFRANKFQPVPTGAAAAGGRGSHSAKGGKVQAHGQQQGKEEAHHRE
jgi:hypothetical protein